MVKVFLRWSPRSECDGYRVYQSTSGISRSDLPAPVATLGNDAIGYDADSDIGLYFMLEAFNTAPAASAFTESIKVDAPVDGEVIAPPVSVSWPVYYDDVMTTATINGAWGLRRLVSSYNGNIARIRDTDDDTEQDVGIGTDGYLADFTVIGEARLVLLYDQSGNSNDIGQTIEASQPLVRVTDSFRGRPEIKFNGGGEYLKDPTYGTSKAYMTAQPFLAVEGSGTGDGQNWGCLAGIAHAPGSHSPPFFRLGMVRYYNGNTVQMTTQDGGGASTDVSACLNHFPSTGILIASTGADRIVGNGGSTPGPSGASPLITYPNATGLFVGAHGNVNEYWGGTIDSVVIGQDSTVTQSEVEGYALSILNGDEVIPPGGLVLDLPLSGDLDVTEDTDLALGHKVWFREGARLLGVGEGLELDGDGRVIVEGSNATQPTGDWTIEADIYWDVIAGDNVIMSCMQMNGDTGGWRFASVYDDGGNLSFVTNTTDIGANYCTTSGAGMVVDQWYSIVITRSITTISIYVDGVLRGTDTSPPDILPINSPLFLGYNISNGAPMQGKLRNLKIYNGEVITP